MKLTVVTVEQSTLMNLNNLQKCNQLNTKDLLKIKTVKRMKLLNTPVGIYLLKVNNRNTRTRLGLVGKKSKKLYTHSLKNRNHMNNHKISGILTKISLPNL